MRMFQPDDVVRAVGEDLHVLAASLLDDVAAVVNDLPPPALDWVPPHLRNNPFTLVYHLLGSAQYWIGEVVGGTPTDRVRAAEFDRRGTHEELAERLQETRRRLQQTLSGLTAQDLLPHPVDLRRGVLSWGDVPPEGRTSIWVIAHDLCHVAYHLGQLNLLRQIWTGEQKESADSPV